MPSTKNHRKVGHEKNKKGRLSEKASSFHGRDGGGGAAEMMLHRPRTVPDLLAGRRTATEEVRAQARPSKLTRLLLNVTIQRSPGAVQVVISPEAKVEELIEAALRQYKKEARRPVLSTGASGFDLHYSQFSLEKLDREEKLIDLGSRNFFLCPNTASGVAESGGGALTASSSSCSKEADKEACSKKGLPWLKFMDFLK